MFVSALALSEPVQADVAVAVASTGGESFAAAAEVEGIVALVSGGEAAASSGAPAAV